MMLRRAAVALGCFLTARGQLPQVLEEAIDHIQPRARAELETFFAPGGPHATFRIRIEEGCIGGAFPVYDWKKLYVPVDAKWGLESLIAARLHQSKWFDKDADTSLVAFRPHTGERSLLTQCRIKLEREFPWKTVLVRGGDGPRPVLRRRPAPGPRPAEPPLPRRQRRTAAGRVALPGAQRETRVARAGDAGHGAAAPVLRPFARRRAAAAGVPAGAPSGVKIIQ